MVSDLDVRIREEVGASATSLTEVFGVGPILAAKIIGLVGDVSRFPGKGHGNRRLNHALHMIALNQVRYKGEGGGSPERDRRARRTTRPIGGASRP